MSRWHIEPYEVQDVFCLIQWLTQNNYIIEQVYSVECDIRINDVCCDRAIDMGTYKDMFRLHFTREEFFDRSLRVLPTRPDPFLEYDLCETPSL